jgi:hypothetical protein
VVSDSGREICAGTEKESCVDGNIKTTYGSVSYLARKLYHLPCCIGKKRKFSSILLHTDDNHHEKPAE